MTAIVLGLTLIAGAISTLVLFFQIDDLGWYPFLGALVGTALVSLLIKLWEITEAALANSVTAIGQLNAVAQQLHELQSRGR